MKPPFILITRCFSEVTPESAENCDTSDTGFVYEDAPFTFSDLVHEIESGGFHRDGGTEWLSTYPWVESYETMTERDESLHFSQANPEHMRKWFELAVKFASWRASKLTPEMLNARLLAVRLLPLDDEQVRVLIDPTEREQRRAMLEDLRDRCLILVSDQELEWATR